MLFLMPLFIMGLWLLWAFRPALSWRQGRGKRGDGLSERIISRINRRLAPYRSTPLYQWYVKQLYPAGKTVGHFFFGKLLFFFVLLVLFTGVYYTNLAAHTQVLLKPQSLPINLLLDDRGTEGDQKLLLEEEGYFMALALERIDKADLTQQPDLLVIESLEALVQNSGRRLHQDSRTLANLLYYRLLRYYRVRSFPFSGLLLVILLAALLPELGLMLYTRLTEKEKKKELRFLKRLMILNGSIKPVDFMQVLRILIEKSRRYRPMLLEIERDNKRNSVPNDSIYRRYLELERDIDVKLFLEKMDQANNYDFDQAIRNIENEFGLERRQQMRQIRKRIELIHVWGIVCSFLLIALLTVYMLIPWLSAYDIRQMI